MRLREWVEIVTKSFKSKKWKTNAKREQTALTEHGEAGKETDNRQIGQSAHISQINQFEQGNKTSDKKVCCDNWEGYVMWRTGLRVREIKWKSWRKRTEGVCNSTTRANLKVRLSKKKKTGRVLFVKGVFYLIWLPAAAGKTSQQTNIPRFII